MWRKRALCPGQPAPAGAAPGGGGPPMAGSREHDVNMTEPLCGSIKILYHVCLCVKPVKTQENKKKT